jgi:hypothetical protein
MVLKLTLFLTWQTHKAPSPDTRFQSTGVERGGLLTLQELGHTVLDGRHTRARAVRADRVALAQQPLCPLHHVGLVAALLHQHVGAVDEAGVLEQRRDLAEEGDGLLVQLLRVADVGADDLAEGQVGAGAAGDLGAVLLRLDRQLAADGVLGLLDVRVDGGDGEALRHLGGRCCLSLCVVC